MEDTPAFSPPLSTAYRDLRPRRAALVSAGRWLFSLLSKPAAAASCVAGLIDMLMRTAGCQEAMHWMRYSDFRTVRKLLILNGEMSEWLKERARKAIRATLTKSH